MSEPVTHKMTVDELHRILNSRYRKAKVSIEYDELAGMIRGGEDITDMVRTIVAQLKALKEAL